jgi:hypothetical protein
MSQEGKQIGGCYHDALVPAEYFADEFGDFLVRENFAATLNSASDKEKAKIKMHAKFFGAAPCRTISSVSYYCRTTWLSMWGRRISRALTSSRLIH